jgi:hypothetical protein
MTFGATFLDSIHAQKRFWRDLGQGGRPDFKGTIRAARAFWDLADGTPKRSIFHS